MVSITIILIRKWTFGGIPPPFSDFCGYTIYTHPAAISRRPHSLRKRFSHTYRTATSHAKHSKQLARKLRDVFSRYITQAHTGPAAYPRLSDVPGGIPRKLYYFYLLPLLVYILPPLVREYAPSCPRFQSLPNTDCGTTKRTAHTMQTNTALCRP